MPENGYTTIFYEGNEGVTIHKSWTLTITTSEPPVLRGSKPTGSNLWTVLTDWDKSKCEDANNVYDLPLTTETIKYLHPSAGHPVKDTWTKAIKAGNFTTWSGLSVKAVHKYFPESDETKQGHMNKQRQNVRSTVGWDARIVHKIFRVWIFCKLGERVAITKLGERVAITKLGEQVAITKLGEQVAGNTKLEWWSFVYLPP